MVSLHKMRLPSALQFCIFDINPNAWRSNCWSLIVVSARHLSALVSDRLGFPGRNKRTQNGRKQKKNCAKLHHRPNLRMKFHGCSYFHHRTPNYWKSRRIAVLLIITMNNSPKTNFCQFSHQYSSSRLQTEHARADYTIFWFGFWSNLPMNASNPAPASSILNFRCIFVLLFHKYPNPFKSLHQRASEKFRQNKNFEKAKRWWNKLSPGCLDAGAGMLVSSSDFSMIQMVVGAIGQVRVQAILSRTALSTE